MRLIYTCMGNEMKHKEKSASVTTNEIHAALLKKNAMMRIVHQLIHFFQTVVPFYMVQVLC